VILQVAHTGIYQTAAEHSPSGASSGTNDAKRGNVRAT